MANICELTGKKPMSGHRVSHANNKTKRKFYPNLKKVTLKSEILKKNVNLKISTRALKAVDFRGGLDQFLIRSPQLLPYHIPKENQIKPTSKREHLISLSLVFYLHKNTIFIFYEFLFFSLISRTTSKLVK